MSNLITAIRSSCEDNETYDLGGQSIATISNVIESAFQEPFLLDKMIKITFIVGAGKQARSKYDPNTTKVVTSILRDKCNYNEDRGASCIMECAGSYKVQHDTGKNLFTVMVFPKVSVKSTSTSTTSNFDGYGDDDDTEEPIIPHESAGYKVAICTMSVFPQMVKSKCPTWTEKKSLLQCLEALQTLVEEMDQKLIHGVELTKQEDQFYNDVDNLEEKHTFVKHEMHIQVMETKQITAQEKQLLLDQCINRITKLHKQNNSHQKQEELRKLQQRQEVLESITVPTPLPKLKYYGEMSKLYKEFKTTPGLYNIEETTKGRLCSIKETQMMTRKDEIMEQLHMLEEQSRNWFEEDDVFDMRLQQTRNELSSMYLKNVISKNKSKSKTTLANSKLKVGSSANKWVTPGQKQQEHNHWSSALAAKKKKRPKGGALFQAMMMDDSDDDDDDDDDDEGYSNVHDGEQEQEQQSHGTVITTTTTPKKTNKKSSTKGTATDEAPSTTAAFTTSTKTNKAKSKNKKNKNKKNKKSNKGSNKQGNDDGDDENVNAAAATDADTVLDDAIQSNQDQQRQKEKEPTTSLDYVRIAVLDYIFPLLGAFLAWLVTLMFGNNKNSKKNKKKKNN